MEIKPLKSSVTMEISDGNIHGRRRSRTRKDGALRKWKRDGIGYATPPVKWLFNAAAEDGAPMSREKSSSRWVVGDHVQSVSARKLAAGLWHLEARTSSVSTGGGGGMTWHWRRSRFGRLLFELHSPLPTPEPAKEEASKWNHSNEKAPTEVHQPHSFVQHVKSQQFATVSVTSALQIELVRVRDRVKELETERFFFKKKLKHLLKWLSEEKVSWIRREQQKMNAIIDELKDEVRRERRNYQKMDIINSKLLTDLAAAKFSAQQLIDDYQNERKAKELLEDICNELVKEFEDSKAAVKSVEVQCSRIQDELTEERKMLQMAEVWREERVQMKLVDAKLILEEKYQQMNKLIGDLETFFRSRVATLETSKMNEAMEIMEALDASNVLDTDELHYSPPRSYDICTIMEDLQSSGANESEIDQCLRPSPASHSSEIQNINPSSNEFTQISVYGHSSNIDCDRNSGNGGIKESVNHGEDEQSSYSFSSNAYFANRTGGDRYMSSVVTDPDQNENQEPLSSSINTISPEQQQFKGKGSSFPKLWKSSLNSDGVCKNVSFDGNRRISSASDSSKVDISPGEVSGGVTLNQHEIVTQWSSPGQRNPHISRAMKGCIEWPRGIQKYSLKPRLIESSLERQKTQLRNVLKQRISVNTGEYFKEMERSEEDTAF